MKPENRVKGRLLNCIRRRGHSVYPIENIVVIGMPDVVFIRHTTGRAGWIEMKFLQRMPVGRSSKLLSSGQLSVDQRAFLVQESTRHGGAFLVATNGERWFLMTGNGLRTADVSAVEEWLEVRGEEEMADIILA